MGLFKDSFGDLSKREQKKLAKTLLKICKTINANCKQQLDTSELKEVGI